MAELLNNVWFKHLVAAWQQEAEIAINAVCNLPVNDVGTAISLLRQRNVLAVYRDCIRTPYETYNELVETKENPNNERTNDPGTD